MSRGELLSGARCRGPRTCLGALDVLTQRRGNASTRHLLARWFVSAGNRVASQVPFVSVPELTSTSPTRIRYLNAFLSHSTIRLPLNKQGTEKGVDTLFNILNAFTIFAHIAADNTHTHTEPTYFFVVALRMYNPLKPNVYVEYKYERYCKRRRDEEAAIEKHRREREDTGNALSDALAGMSAPSNLIQHAGHVVSELPSLNLTAEEMHRLRVKESAARGVQRAVEMENDSLLVEQKTRRQEGTDTRGKISSLLDKMRKRANTQEPTAAAPSSDTTAPSSVPPSGKGTASVSGADGIRATPPSSSGPSSPVAPSSAPLGFKRSRMAAGGYVLDTIDGTAGGAPAAAGSPPSARMKVSLRGKPSSTLLIRFRTQPSPLTVVAASLGESARAAEYETALAPLLETIRQTCGRHGVVRSVRTCVLSASELATKAHDLSTTAQAEHESYLEKEKLRVFVRLDTVAEAFKAAEAIAAVQPSPAAVAMSPAAWSVVFFPSSLYDDGRLGPSDTEGLC